MRRFRGWLTAGGEIVLDAANAVDATGPLPSYAGCHVLMRGYLADRAALCSRLGLALLSQDDDAKLLAHAYRRWGHELQKHVTGEFAAVIADAHERSALLSHDALGVLTLFYAERDGGLAFATDIEDLVDEAAVAALDEEYLADYLAHGAPTGPRTPYRAIRRLLPGRSLRWSGGRIREAEGWNLAGIPALMCRDDAEYEERFRALLDDAVRSAFDGGGPAWIALSGGLDSSSVAAVAARAAAPRALAAYSVVSDRWPEVDERRWIGAVVEQYGLSWHPRDVEVALPFSRLPSSYYGEPTIRVIDEGSIAVTNDLLMANGVRAVVSGTGGDTVLGASPGTVPTHLADPLFGGHPLGAVRAALRWRRDAPDARSSTHWLLRGVVEPARDHLRRERISGSEPLRLPGWLAPEYARTAQLASRARRGLAPRCRQPGRQATWDGLWSITIAVSAAAGQHRPYDLRLPLLYRPLVEFMSAIPWDQKLRPRCDRSLQRRALAGILPEIVRRRASKAGGTAPFVEGLRRSPEWRAYLTDSSALAERGMIDAERWREAVRQASVGRTGGDRAFLGAVALESWLKQLSSRSRTHPDPSGGRAVLAQV